MCRMGQIQGRLLCLVRRDSGQRWGRDRGNVKSFFRPAKTHLIRAVASLSVPIPSPLCIFVCQRDVLSRTISIPLMKEGFNMSLA